MIDEIVNLNPSPKIGGIYIRLILSASQVVPQIKHKSAYRTKTLGVISKVSYEEFGENAVVQPKVYFDCTSKRCCQRKTAGLAT